MDIVRTRTIMLHYSLLLANQEAGTLRTGFVKQDAGLGIWYYRQEMNCCNSGI